jgi:hypothetical protein
MSERIELPNGAWANLRTPSAVPERLRRPVTKAMFVIASGSAGKALLEVKEDLTDEEKAAQVAQSLNPDTLDLYSSLNDLLIVARVSEWSFELPITLDGVLDLPSSAYEILQEVTAKGITEMMPNFATSDDKDSPTHPLSA